MNIRKNIDYTKMYAALDAAMAAEAEQMELYIRIGQAVCQRTEKGAAVAAAEYLRKRYPDVQGFSPRNLRRMRDFCRTYEKHPVLLSLTMNLSWTQNVVIMEADLTMEFRKWYLRAARQFGWSKTELSARIAEQAHLEIVMDIEQEVCDNGTNEAESISGSIWNAATYSNRHFEQRVLLLRRCRGRPKTDPVGVRKKRLRYGSGEQGRTPEDLSWPRLHRYRLGLRLRYANQSIGLYSTEGYGRILQTKEGLVIQVGLRCNTTSSHTPNIYGALVL